MIDPIIITEPTVRPVTVSEIKSHLRITNDVEDLDLEFFAVAATQVFQRLTGRTLYETEYEIALEEFPPSPCPIVLPMAAPLLSITSIKYLDNDGVENTWAASGYVLDTHSLPGRVAPAYGATYPSFTAYPLSPIRIRYKAGISNTQSPMFRANPSFRRAILELIGSSYENRESETITDRASIEAKMLQYGARCVLDNWRVG